MPLQATDLLYARFLDSVQTPPAKEGCEPEVGCEAACPRALDVRNNQERLNNLLQQLEDLPLYDLLGELGVPLTVVEVLNRDDTAASANDEQITQVTERHLVAITVLSALQLAANSSPRARELFTRSLLIGSSPSCASMAVAQRLKSEVGGDRPMAPLNEEIESLSKQIL